MTPPRFLAAISTPFAADAGVDLDAFEAHLAWLADAGLDGEEEAPSHPDLRLATCWSAESV